jgi:hypothetical protein
MAKTAPKRLAGALRRGEETTYKDGKEPSRQDKGPRGTSQRPAGTSTPRDMTSVGKTPSNPQRCSPYLATTFLAQHGVDRRQDCGVYYLRSFTGVEHRARRYA